MHDRRGWWAGVLMVLGVLAPPASAAEEARMTQGRRRAGSLSVDSGRLRFTSAQGEAIPLTDISRIHFTAGRALPFRIGDGRRVHLRDGQCLTGQILALDRDTLQMRTAWTDRLALPRASLASIDPLPGWRLVAADDFHDGLRDFSTAGEPGLIKARSVGAPRAVILRNGGQRVAYTPEKPVAAGRIGINFEEQEQARGARWTLEVSFARAQRLSVSVAGEGDGYAVAAEGCRGEVRQVARQSGWHRLIVTFDKRSLRVTCDDDVLWYNVEEGVAGPLKQVTINCHRAGEETPNGAVAWSEFTLERAVDEHPRPVGESEQDEVCLNTDDQLFGHIVQADRHSIAIESGFGKRSLPWTAVAGCAFRRTAPAVTTGQAKVRLLLSSGLCPQPDVLDGAVSSLDDRRLILRHALLGEVTIERGRVRELRPLPAAAK